MVDWIAKVILEIVRKKKILDVTRDSCGRIMRRDGGCSPFVAGNLCLNISSTFI
jgi:hypothetical protein